MHENFQIEIHFVHFILSIQCRTSRIHLDGSSLPLNSFETLSKSIRPNLLISVDEGYSQLELGKNGLEGNFFELIQLYESTIKDHQEQKHIQKFT